METLYFGIVLIFYALSAFGSIWATEEVSKTPGFTENERRFCVSMGIFISVVPIFNTIHTLQYLKSKKK